MLHGTVDYQKAVELHDALQVWLSQINLVAAQSLDEAQQETLTVVRLQAPALLRATLISTNPIESCYASTRQAIRRVKNWSRGHDQILRWVAVALLDAEKRFNRVRGYRDIPLFIKAAMRHSGE